MLERVKLPVLTSDGRPLVHAFKQHVHGAQRLVVAFPGNHYGVDGPLLYYPMAWLAEGGWDTLAVTYGFQSKSEVFRPEQMSDVLQESQSVLEVALQTSQYDRLVLIGKSLGAFVVAYLAAQLPAVAQARCVYLTPPIDNPFFAASLEDAQQAAYLAVGSADRFFDSDTLEQLRASPNIQVRLIEAADHSLNFMGDLAASLDVLHSVSQDVINFVQSA